MLEEFHFLRPFWLLSVPVLWFLVFCVLSKLWTNVNLEKLVEPHFLKFLITGSETKKDRLLSFSIFFTGTLILLALSGPTWEKIPQPLLLKSHARVFVLDLSFSMLANDIKPTRLDRVRFKMKDLLSRFEEGETGLVVYAGEAFVISPLTHDAETISAMLPGLQPSIMPVLGSKAANAIELASDLLSQSKREEGHIIWITDGIEQDDYSEIQSKVGKNRISILAVGTSSGSPVVLPDGGFLKDRKGSIVIPKLNSQLLENFAYENKGVFSLLSIDDNDVEGIIRSEKSSGEFIEDEKRERAYKWKEEGPWLLLLALPIAALFFRRGLLFSWSVLILLGVYAVPNLATAFEWEDLWFRKDQQAEKMFRNGDTKSAAQFFKNSEWKGTAAYRSGEYEKAAKEFAMNESLISNFNLGNSLALAGRLEDAIIAYDKVLAENPEHEDAKYNRNLIENMLHEEEKNEQKDKADKDKENNEQSHTDDKLNQDTKNNEKYEVENSSNINRADEARDQRKNNSKKESSDNSALNENYKLEETKKKREEKDKKNNILKENITSTDEKNLDLKKQNKNQLFEQWLRKIPDDPGRLLRNKMKLEYRRRGNSREVNENYW